MTMTAHTGWLIEAAGPKYWDGHTPSRFSFTTDANSAIRFCRKIDAEAVIYGGAFVEDIRDMLVAREHSWVTPEEMAAARKELTK